jgi:hypothetical protein
MEYLTLAGKNKLLLTEAANRGKIPYGFLGNFSVWRTPREA